jgi:hypothetical protein
MGSLCKILVTNPDASYATSYVASAAHGIDVTMKNMDDGATGDESGNFAVWSGSSPASLLFIENKAISTGVIATSALGIATDVKYVELRKDGYSRTGIMKVTLI